MIATDSLLLQAILGAPQCRNCYLRPCGCKELDEWEAEPQDDAETINADRLDMGEQS